MTMHVACRKSPGRSIAQGGRRQYPLWFHSVLPALVLLSVGIGAFAAPPATVNIRGQVVDSEGLAITGSRAYAIQFFDAETEWRALGAELTGNVELSAEGLFNISALIPPEVLASATPWYAIAVDSDPSPNGVDANDWFLDRVKVQSVPFALQAAEALHVEPAAVGAGNVDATELDALDGVTGAIQPQIDQKANSADVYTQAEVDAAQATQDAAIMAKANSADVYTQAEVDAAQVTQDAVIAAKANSADVYTQAEVDAAVAPKLTFAWEVTSGTAVQAEPNRGYVANDVSLVTITLPLSSSCSVGDTVRVSGLGAGGWKIAQNAGQQILLTPLAIPAPQTWTARDINREWQSVASSSDGTKLVASVLGGQLYTSTDSGANWTPRDSSRDWEGVASSSDGTKLVACEFIGKLYTSTDSGANWTPRDNTRNWYGVASSSDGTKLVACEFIGKLYTSTDSGVNWTPGDSTRLWTNAASSSDGTKLVASVDGGQLYTSTDSGVTWTPQDSNRTWYGVASSSDGTKLVACALGGQVQTSPASGAFWMVQDSNRDWLSVASSSDGTRLVACVQGGQIYTYREWLTETTTGTSGSVTGGSGAALELQYIGNDTFRPLSHEGSLGTN